MYLIACDFDGTLKINDQVNPKDIEAIKLFRQQGNKFVVCTGRTINSVYHQLLKYEIPFDYIIGVNGAITINPDYDIVFSHNFTTDVFEGIQKAISKFDVKNYQISNGFDYINIEGNGQVNVKEIDISAIRGYFFITDNHHEARRIAQYLNNKLSKKGLMAYSNNNFVAVGMSGIHKGYGVDMLAQKINWQANICVIGDDYNDIPMFKRFNSFGIKSGYQEAIKYADHHVNHVHEVLNYILKKENT